MIQEEKATINQYFHQLKQFRLQIHQNPEIGFQQFKTRARIIDLLKRFGVKENQIAKLSEKNPTALVVDLWGSGKPDSEGKKMIAFRADMDALSMVEKTQGISYRADEKLGAAHMCGHDGHVACLVGFVPLFLNQIRSIPSNRCVRLLFQPSEEGPQSGAKAMIQDNAIDDVDEVYAFHNYPNIARGQFLCIPGPVMSEITVFKIKIQGDGGHGALDSNKKISVKAGVILYQQLMELIENLKTQYQNKFTCTFPCFHSGQRFNVIDKQTIIEGSLRSLVKGLKQIVIKNINKLGEGLKQEGFQFQFDHSHGYPMVDNHPDQTQHLIHLAQEHFGQEHIYNHQGILPTMASQDFSYFLQRKPGTYFFLTSGAPHKQEKEQYKLHTNHYDFNDDLILIASPFWLKLALDKLRRI